MDEWFINVLRDRDEEFMIEIYKIGHQHRMRQVFDEMFLHKK